MPRVSSQEKILKINHAALQLIQRKEATDISIYDVAKQCGMATSTVYHHYANIESLLKTLLKDVFDDFDTLLESCVDETKLTHWSDLNRMIESAYVQYYNQSAIAKKLILGRHSFTELLHADTEHDFALGLRVENLYRRYFDIPTLPEPINIFAISLQVADKIYAISYRENGYITPDLATEAIRLTQSYLQLYIPAVCPFTRHPPLSPLRCT